MTKEEVKKVLLSVLIGAGVAFLTKLLEGLFNVLNNWILDYTGTLASMLYYLKSSSRTKIV